MAANVIAENMFTSVDKEGYRHKLLDTIIDIRKTDEAVKKEDDFITRVSNRNFFSVFSVFDFFSVFGFFRQPKKPKKTKKGKRQIPIKKHSTGPF